MNEVRVEVAKTPYDREMGLQFVKQMEPDHGMLFRFDRPQVLSFWMKNTYLPLDIAFISDEGRIIKTEQMVPLSLSSVSSEKPCSIALEVPAGRLKEMGWEVGTVVDIDWEEELVRDSNQD